MSEKPRFTPGTWIAECVGTGGTYDNPVDVYEVSNGYKRIAGHLMEGDAHLIAASPELYAALEAMVESYQHEASAENPALLQARTALARARGES